jgi:hypothetical protein
MLLNARAVFMQSNAYTLILLAIEDATDRHAAEHEMADLLQKEDILLQEMQHRVANACRSLPASFCSRRGDPIDLLRISPGSARR